MKRITIDKHFRIQWDVMIRIVELSNGRDYRHHCGLEAFKEVAYFIEEHKKEGVTSNMLWAGLPGVAKT